MSAIIIGSAIFVAIGIFGCIFGSFYVSSRTKDQAQKSENKS